jgi:hypothetical protein
MPTFLSSVATKNSAYWPDLGISSTWAEIILAFRVSKATLVVSECTTFPGNDFRHKSVNGAEQSAKCVVNKFTIKRTESNKILNLFFVSGKG